MRRALNSFEELPSVGALATGLQHLTQVEIAERLGVPQVDVSLGLACLEHRDAILPKLKRGEVLQATLPPALTGEQAQAYDVRGIPTTAKRARRAMQ